VIFIPSAQVVSAEIVLVGPASTVDPLLDPPLLLPLPLPLLPLPPPLLPPPLEEPPLLLPLDPLPDDVSPGCVMGEPSPPVEGLDEHATTTAEVAMSVASSG
jgi:hypothetical protein